MVRLVWIVWLVAVAVSCVPGPPSQAATDVFVRPGDSVQAAIDVAEPGTAIDLGPGTYAGSLRISRSLTLRGDVAGTVVEGTQPGSAVRISGEGIHARLENLTVRGGRGWYGQGIETAGTLTVELVGVTSTQNEWCGLWVTDRSTILLEGCHLVENRTHGLYAWDFAVIRATQTEISRNQTHGILALHITEITLVDCVVDGNLSGVWAWDGARVHATRTRVVDSSLGGLTSQNGALLDLVSCQVTGSGQWGVCVSDSSRAVLSDCAITGNGTDGVLVEQDGIAEIERCVVEGNGGVGVRAATPSCTGSFDPARPFKGWIEGEGNTVPGPAEKDGNRGGALCPSYPGNLWPAGFLVPQES